VFLPRSGRAADGAAGTAGSLPLTAAHRRRRAVYSSPPDAAQRARLQRQRLGPGQAGRGEMEAFVARELQALLLQQDVGLVAQHTLGTLRNAAAATRPSNAAVRGAAARPANGTGSQRQAGNSSGAPLPEVAAQLAAAAAPFVFEHAERFAWEVAAFAASPCASMAAYDRQTQLMDASAAAAAAAAGASAARQQLGERAALQAGTAGSSGRPDGSLERGSSSDDGGYPGSSGSSGSEERRRGAGPADAQRSDSEGYLGLLLLQGSQRRPRQQQEQSQQPADPSQAAQDTAEGGGGRAGYRHSGGGSRSASPSGRGDGGRKARRQREASSSRSGSPSGNRSPRHRRQHRKSRRRRRREREDGSRSRSPERRRNGGSCLADEGAPYRENGSPQPAAAAELAALRERARAALQQHRQRQAG
jgi:hypothetical protein